MLIADSEPVTYEYALVRVVPNIERGEFLNAGVVLSCSARDFLGARIELDENRLRALFRDANAALIREHLRNFQLVCEGTGPIGMLPHRARFHWLTAPRSTCIQTSPAHSGFCLEPQSALDAIFAKMVAPPARLCPANRDDAYDR